MKERLIAQIRAAVRAKNRFYFQGKTARASRAALEYIAAIILNDAYTTQNYLAERYGTTPASIQHRYQDIVRVLGWTEEIEKMKHKFYEPKMNSNSSQSEPRVIVNGTQEKQQLSS